ncbi:MAG: lysine--tRNA ligase [Thermoprotei archaeon]
MSQEAQPKHWLDRFVDKIVLAGKRNLVISGGMAPAGPIHIGKIRGEVIYPSAIYRELVKKGFNVEHIIVIYTQDPLKAKEPLVTRQFIEQWKGVRILNVPDPWGCHANWVDHFMEPYLESYEAYGITAKPVYTHESYKNPRMQEAVKRIIEQREKARNVLNKYKGGKLEATWFPIKALCEKCYNILDTKVTKYYPEKGIIEYTCPRCGHKGITTLENAKLEWRAEWASLWYTYKVDIELYGKDHAAAGGSRESCNELIREIFGVSPPEGFPYEWVSLIKNGKREEMGSSEGVSFDIDEWLRVGRPEVLKYWYFVMKPLSHLDFDPLKTPPLLHDEYDRAERIYFGTEEPAEKDTIIDIRRAYELANDGKPPEKIGLQVPYLVLAIIDQIIPEGPERLNEAIKRLQRTGHIKNTPMIEELKIIERLLPKAGYWARKYAPENYRITLQNSVPQEIKIRIDQNQKELLKQLYTLLKAWTEPNSQKLEAEIYSLIKQANIKPQDAYKTLYMILLGKPNGPRIASFMLAIGTDKVLKLISEAIENP